MLALMQNYIMGCLTTQGHSKFLKTLTQECKSKYKNMIFATNFNKQELRNDNTCKNCCLHFALELKILNPQGRTVKSPLKLTAIKSGNELKAEETKHSFEIKK